MKHVTLAHIAAELGISKYSVSRALSGKPGVSEDTRRKVLSTARALGYDHASLAPSLPRIVLLIPHQDLDDMEFWMGVTRGASMEAEALGYTFVTRPLENPPSHHPAALDKVGGVIVAGSRARPALEPYLDASLPAVLVTYARPLEPHDAVHPADWEGGQAVAEHLVQLGHKHLAYVTEAPDKPSFAGRARGFREAASRFADVEARELHIDADEPGVSFERAYRRLASQGQGPTGILTSTDGIAFAVVWALGRMGLDVPHDVSLVGFNDATASVRFVPKLTTLRIPTQDLGRAAMRFLHERIADPGRPPRRLQLAPEFILRDSTGPARAEAVRLERTTAALLTDRRR